MNPFSLLEKHFSGNNAALDIVYRHSQMVANKALSIAERVNVTGADLQFI